MAKYVRIDRGVYLGEGGYVKLTPAPLSHLEVVDSKLPAPQKSTNSVIACTSPLCKDIIQFYLHLIQHTVLFTSYTTYSFIYFLYNISILT